MSRLTGKEVYSLMEAYQQVYAPQELTEEQVWEGVENWVNSLLEEGYDLSDYTWEDMYESYLSELTYPDGPAIPTPKPKPIPSSNYNYTPKDLGAKQYADFKFGGGNASVGDSYTAADVVARGRAAKAAALKAVPSSKYPYTPKDLGAKQYADFKFGGGNASVGDSYTAADVVARGRAAKAAAPANPSQYTSKNLGAKQYADFKFGGGDEAIRKGASAGEVVAQGRKNMPTPPSGPKIVGPKIVGPKIVGTGPKNFGSPSLTKKPIMASFDMFDVVLGHLIDEGYADTYEAALTIMTNMSEDWKYSIVEAYEEFPMQKVVKKAGELMGSSAGKNDPKSKKREKRGIKMMNIASTHTPDR